MTNLYEFSERSESLTTTEKLRAEIKRQKLTVKQAAELSGIKPTSLYGALERGRIKLIPFLNLCQALNLNFMDMADDPPAEQAEGVSK